MYVLLIAVATCIGFTINSSCSADEDYDYSSDNNELFTRAEREMGRGNENGQSELEAYKSTVPWNHFKNIVPITDEDDAEGIEETLSDSPSMGRGIFNLQGQRINGLQKGLNIQDGKKVWVK
jgi:hypothetical protein